jgi:hypothetical protein
MRYFQHPDDPTALLDYAVDWTPELDVSGDTIVASTWEADATVTVLSDDYNTLQTVIWVKVTGVAGSLHTLTNRIVSTQGRHAPRSIVLILGEC